MTDHISSTIHCHLPSFYTGTKLYLGDLVAQQLGRRTCDQAVVGSIPSRAAIKLPRSARPSIPPGQVNHVPAWLAGVMAGHIHLCLVAGNTV